MVAKVVKSIHSGLHGGKLAPKSLRVVRREVATDCWGALCESDLARGANATAPAAKSRVPAPGGGLGPCERGVGCRAPLGGDAKGCAGGGERTMVTLRDGGPIARRIPTAEASLVVTGIRGKFMLGDESTRSGRLRERL